MEAVIAVDTNVIIRIIVNDDRSQVGRALALIAQRDVLVTTTVVLEVAWVLDSTYGLSRNRLAGSLRGFLGLPGITVEEPERVERALVLYEADHDFADAMHATGLPEQAGFATFDRKLVRKISVSMPELEIVQL